MPNKRKPGTIEAIVGCMCSSKTTELIRRLEGLPYARTPHQAFRPSRDTRDAQNVILSRSGASIPCEMLDCAADLRRLVRKKTQVVGIDEAQFLDDELLTIVPELSERGVRVIVSGLDLDSLGNDFGPMMRIVRFATHWHRAQAHCTVCGNLAIRSQRVVPIVEQVHVGSEGYKARCLRHWDPTKFE